MTITLNDEQNRAVDLALHTINLGKVLIKNVYRIGGYAGTGKTTLIKTINERLVSNGQRMHISAFCGKAVSVLRKKGLRNAQTIHRTIYEWDDEGECFIRRPSLSCDAICVDEGSMVPVSLWDDISSYGLPRIVVGDPGQLEPVGEDAKLMHDPDIVLQTIHRYEDGIAWFANTIRTTGTIPKVDNSYCSVRSKSTFMSDLRASLLDNVERANIILCGFNKTRVATNVQIRKILGYKDDIHHNEQMMCLHNDRKHGVYNGTLFKVTMIISRTRDYTVANILLDDDETVLKNVKLWHGHLNQTKSVDWRRYPRGMIVCDYGYCTTVHKFQGSEERRVHVIDEQCELWEAARHRYTYATRASEHVRVYVD